MIIHTFFHNHFTPNNSAPLVLWEDAEDSWVSGPLCSLTSLVTRESLQASRHVYTYLLGWYSVTDRFISLLAFRRYFILFIMYVNDFEKLGQ